MLIAGDLYDGDWKDYNTGLFFVAQMRPAARGRHPGLHRRRQPRRREPDHAGPCACRTTSACFPSDRPETVRLDGLGRRRPRPELRARRPSTSDLARWLPGRRARLLQHRPAAHLRRRPRGPRALRPLHARGAAREGLRLLGARPRPPRARCCCDGPAGRLPRQPPGPPRPRDRARRAAILVTVDGAGRPSARASGRSTWCAGRPRVIDAAACGRRPRRGRPFPRDPLAAPGAATRTC